MKQLALVLLWSIAFGSGASAQPTPERTYRVGVISISSSSIELFRRFAVPELAKRGFVEGPQSHARDAVRRATRHSGACKRSGRHQA